MQISPHLSIALNVAYLLLTAVATGSLSLAGLVDSMTATKIVAIATTLQGVLNVILHAYSSPIPGPLAK